MTKELTFSSDKRFITKAFSSSAMAQINRGNRAIILMIIITIVMVFPTIRLINLQLIEGEVHRQQADKNRIRLMALPAPRGGIFDRKGRVLASNHLIRSIYLWPRDQTPEQWQSTATELSSIINIPAQDILNRLSERGYNSAMPVRISQNITSPTFVAIVERLSGLPGIEIRAEFNRSYPYGNLAAHVLGYIGEASAEDLKNNPKYPFGMIVGKVGIEHIANPQLTGTWGSRLIEVDVRGEELRQIGQQSPLSGLPVETTLDLDLQKTAEKALNNRRGAVVVMDVKTGAVLVMASGPTFDPNLFTHTISNRDWQKLQSQENPLLNRALQGYPPGSTFKIVTATAGMQSGKFSPDSTLMTYDSINIGGIEFHEHGGGYGVIGFPDAFAYSSNTFFYQVGMAAGPEEISKWGHKLGIGDKSNLDILGLDSGSTGVLLSPADKEKIYGEPWYTGDTVSMAIGQGPVLLTPLEEAVMVSAIANGGFRVKPHLLASQTNTAQTTPEPIGIAPEVLATIRSGLIAVVQKGTAQELNDGSIPLTGGKTGTAEVPGQPDNAMYIGFGPAQNPQIAVAVVVENGGFGAVSAVPIAHEIYKTYFQKNLNPEKIERER